MRLCFLILTTQKIDVATELSDEIIMSFDEHSPIDVTERILPINGKITRFLFLLYISFFSIY